MKSNQYAQTLLFGGQLSSTLLFGGQLSSALLFGGQLFTALLFGGQLSSVCSRKFYDFSFYVIKSHELTQWGKRDWLIYIYRASAIHL